MLTSETNALLLNLKGTYKYEINKGAVKLILDGQQRITTLYMLMTGTIPPYYTEKDIENDIMNLYVNLETLELEYCKIKVMENNPLWANITDIFKGKIRKGTLRMFWRKRTMVNDCPVKRKHSFQITSEP